MKCPICNQETTWKNNPTRPFCSERCQLIDLGKWAEGDYRIGGGPNTDIEETSGHTSLDPLEDSDQIH